MKFYLLFEVIPIALYVQIQCAYGNTKASKHACLLLTFSFAFHKSKLEALKNQVICTVEEIYTVYIYSFLGVWMNSIDKILMGCENINHFNSSFHSQKRDVYISSTEVLHYSFGYYYDRSHFKKYFYAGTVTSTFLPYGEHILKKYLI